MKRLIHNKERKRVDTLKKANDLILKIEREYGANTTKCELLINVYVSLGSVIKFIEYGEVRA